MKVSDVKKPPLSRILSEGGGSGGVRCGETPLCLVFRAREVVEVLEVENPPPSRVLSEGGVVVLVSEEYNPPISRFE